MRRGHTLAAFAVAAISLTAVAKPAHAQIGTSFVGVGEFDTDHNYLALVGVSVSPRRPGWSWTAGATAYWLQYPLGIGATRNNTHKSLTSFQPHVGLKDSFTGGDLSATVGYSFGSSSDNGVPFFNGAGGKGVTNGVQFDYWGSGAYNAQALADYNYGSSSLWTRGRVGVRVAQWTAGSASVGGEVGYEKGDSYSATRVGGVLMLTPGPGTGVNFAVGRKLIGKGGTPDATYFTAEIVLYPH